MYSSLCQNYFVCALVLSVRPVHLWELWFISHQKSRDKRSQCIFVLVGSTKIILGDGIAGFFSFKTDIEGVFSAVTNI